MGDHYRPSGALIGLAVTLAGLLVIPFGLDVFMSKTIADLAGLCSLVASPWLYAHVRTVARATAADGVSSQLSASP